MRKGSYIASVPLFWLCGLSLVLSLWSGLSVGVGFDTIKLYSYLNEPLDAEIDLLGADNINISTLMVTLAPASDFEKINMARPYFLNKLRFEVVQQGARTFISVQSDEPVNRVSLEFLVLLHWPEGRLVRAYTLLFDPAPVGQISRRSEDNPKHVTSFSQGTSSAIDKASLENLFETPHQAASESQAVSIPSSQAVSINTSQEAVLEKAKAQGEALIAESKAMANRKPEMLDIPTESSVSALIVSLWRSMKLAFETQKVLWSTNAAVMMLGFVAFAYLKRFRPRLVLRTQDARLKSKKPLAFFDQEFSIRMELAKHYAAIKDIDSAKQVLEAIMSYGNQQERQAAQDLSDRLSLF